MSMWKKGILQGFYVSTAINLSSNLYSKQVEIEIDSWNEHIHQKLVISQRFDQIWSKSIRTSWLQCFLEIRTLSGAVIEPLLNQKFDKPDSWINLSYRSKLQNTVVNRWLMTLFTCNMCQPKKCQLSGNNCIRKKI